MRLLFAAVLLLSTPALAQDVEPDTTADGDPIDLPPKTEPFEVGIFRSVYGVENPAFAVTMQVVNESAYPAYYGASPVLWGGALALGEDLDPALRLTVTQAVTVGITAVLKRAINRPRPYAALAGVDARDRHHTGDDIFDPYSFPSGHTSSAFAIASSVSLSYPEWYVIVPSAAWASAMGLTRMWHGVHYPSDVAVGALIGVASGAAVHFLMPDVFDDEAEAQPVRLVIPL